MKIYLLLIGVLFFNTLLFAATITVTTTADEDDGFLGGGTGISLREAINYGTANDVIELSANATYTLSRTAVNEGLSITPSTGDLDVEKNLTINGNVATINANEIDRVMQIIFGVTVVVNNVTFTNGKSNFSMSAAFGGAIYNSGSLMLNNCIISNSTTGNSGNSEGHGGGIYNNSGTLTMTNCTVSGNRSGIVNFGHYGGGIYNHQGTLVMDKCTVSGNTTHTASNAGGDGGGIYSVMGIIQLTNCTISGNTADRQAGGAFIVSPTGDSFIRFSTITNNTANTGGGGLQGDLTSTNVKVSNTIIAKNIVNNAAPASQAVRDVQNGFISEGYNLIGVVSSTTGYDATDIYALHPAAAIDPNIGALADNGGATFTHALLNPSPAYNAADPSSTLIEDQRGTTRPQFGVRDIGAFESTTVLPVELLTFKGESTGKSVVLKWQTASEINNAGFIVERSKDAKHFEQIGFVVGKGNTTELTNYQFTDNFMATSLHYYRLKQTDFDGTFEYSNIIAVNIKNDELDKPIRLFPNPVQVSFTIENAEGLGILYNAFGQAVKQIQITDNQQDVVITDLPTGIYWLQIRQTNGENTRIQIVKTK